MKWVIHSLALGALTLSTGGVALAQQAPADAPPVYAAPAAAEPAPAAPAPAPVAEAAPPQGQWIQTAEYGWIWVPASATTVAYGDLPYTYLYTPAYGWTWVASPWGWGPYHYGPWIGHPWGHAAYWHGVGRPHVVVRGGPAVHAHAGGGGHGSAHHR
ncbi:MAG TPA: DUF6600 domain-containing protein [Polyangiaceae bacterium]|jgi:hypothetical protein